MPVAFRLTSYNVLADAYATPRLYPAVDREVMAWSRRAPAIVARVAGLRADVVCLQEVETSAWPSLASAFSERGWAGVHAPKGRGRPDGCALLYRENGMLRFADAEPLYFADAADGGAPSGHLALIGTFESDAGRVLVAGTHLRWQAATDSAVEHIGLRQAEELVARCAGLAAGALGIVVCGDFNVSPGEHIARLFAAHGFVDSHATAPQPTANPHRRTTRIDYVYVRGGLVATPQAIPTIDGDTPLPSRLEPSDHLPVTVDLAERAVGRSSNDAPSTDANLMAPTDRRRR